MKISVIIPTYNRADKLDQCLKHLESQDFSKNEFEVIIVDDGSTDKTSTLIKNWQKNSQLNIKFITQKNQGQGVARNQGVAAAVGWLTIFIGDDIFPVTDFLEQHYQFHKQNYEENEAAIGQTAWYPNLNVSDFMLWLTNELPLSKIFAGPQFNFKKLEQNPDNVSYFYFYTSNISIKTALLKINSFDPWFNGYGWEDIELGYRLQAKNNLKLTYLKTAFAYHDHLIEFKDFAKRMEAIGYNAVKLQNRHPKLKVVPSGIKAFVLKIMGCKIVLVASKLIAKFNSYLLPLVYYSTSKYYFWRGVTNAKKQIT